MMKRAITFDACATRFQATTEVVAAPVASASQSYYTTTGVEGSKNRKGAKKSSGCKFYSMFYKRVRLLSFDLRASAASAAHEMYDLHLIALAHRRLRPSGAAHDFAVEFDGEPFGRDREFADQFAERDLFRHLADFPVDLDAQNSSLQGCKMTRRSSAEKPSIAARTSTAARPLVKRGSHA